MHSHTRGKRGGKSAQQCSHWQSERKCPNTRRRRNRNILTAYLSSKVLQRGRESLAVICLCSMDITIAIISIITDLLACNCSAAARIEHKLHVFALTLSSLEVALYQWPSLRSSPNRKITTELATVQNRFHWNGAALWCSISGPAICESQ